MGYTTNIKIEDFTPLNLNGEIDITYANLLSNIFGWTSQVPQRQINVFIRDGVLHCIQRGMEESVYDISELSHSRPVINKKLLRMMSQSNTNDNSNNDDTGVTIPFSGTIRFSPAQGVQNSLTYINGFLAQETSGVSTEELKAYSTTIYDYWRRIVPGGQIEYYLSEKISRVCSHY